MEFNFKISFITKKNKQYVLLGILLVLFAISSCKKQTQNNIIAKELHFMNPVDSFSFNYQSESLKHRDGDYIEYRYGHHLYKDEQGKFKYVSIDSDKQLHIYEFGDESHKYSNKITTEEIDAFNIDGTYIYLLYNNMFYIKDFQLNTVDSFPYIQPHIIQTHGFEFNVPNNNNLFKIDNYYAVTYYIVEKVSGSEDIYKTTDRIFYYFNRDTAFFENDACYDLDTSFQYFRELAIASDGEFLFHAPTVLNCISKSNQNGTIIHNRISETHNYLSFHPEDIYQISKMKEYRFSTDFNEIILVDGSYKYLIKGIAHKIYTKNNVKKYDRCFEVIKMDKELNVVDKKYINKQYLTYVYIDNGILYLFELKKGKCYLYEV